jgi:hypothetical protein
MRDLRGKVKLLVFHRVPGTLSDPKGTLCSREMQVFGWEQVAIYTQEE